jgi:hypothetical protein
MIFRDERHISGKVCQVNKQTKRKVSDPLLMAGMM